MKFVFHAFLFLALPSCSYGPFSKDSSKELFEAQKLWKALPVQHGGRVKPFDSFSREILRAVYGKERYKGRSAAELVLSWLIIPDFWEEAEFILLEGEIKKSLGLPLKQKRFRPSELKASQKLALQLAELKGLRRREAELDSYFKKLEKLETRLILYEAVKTGFLFRLEPQGKSSAWLPLPEMTEPAEKRFKKLLSHYIKLIANSALSSLPEGEAGQANKSSAPPSGKSAAPARGESLLDSRLRGNDGLAAPARGESLLDSRFRGNDGLAAPGRAESLPPQNFLKSFTEEMAGFQNLIFKEKKRPSKIKAEIFYNSFKPFQKAWIFYFLFLLACAALLIFKKPDFLKWPLPLAALGFASHTMGLGLRSYIMSRPPVSNMYETVVWVPWTALIAGFVFYLRGIKPPFAASALLAFFCLLLTSLAPEILDARLQPLEAVLNSNFWLATHVLIITMSYSFFFLAFVLGDMALLSYLFKKTKPMALIDKMFHPIYRSIQWGLVFLAAGTILGGIWADYSWGRFWGWDPKESWALISLLAYLALLHGRLAGWTGPFGMAVGAVMMFFSVIMAWYGVNFILGAGLHSYGFGSGGAEYVAGFLLAHLALCSFALWKKRGHSLKGFKPSL